jgi:phage terminase small subunit
LNDKQTAFANEYLIDFNATAAYKRAGYTAKGHAAEVNASRLLSNAEVQARIRAVLSEAAKRSNATLERIELELERVALSDPRKLFTAGGALKPPAEWDDDMAAIIAYTETTETYKGSGNARKLKGNLTKLKMCDKLSAIVSLLKRRDLAGKGELKSNDSPIHPRIAFIEFADVADGKESAEAFNGDAQRQSGAVQEPNPG